MITREAAGTIYTHAGPEIGVASTKAFNRPTHSSLICLLLPRASARRYDTEQPAPQCKELTRIPGKLEALLTRDEECDEFGQAISKVHDFLFLAEASTIHRPRRRSQAERNFLHPRRGIPRRPR